MARVNTDLQANGELFQTGVEVPVVNRACDELTRLHGKVRSQDYSDASHTLLMQWVWRPIRSARQ